MRKILLAATLAVASSATATPPIMPPTPGPPPRLLIVITVDQLSADLFDEYRPHFAGGFARLARGTVFRNAYQAHATTETCPGDATIATGLHPAQSGIIANRWVDQSVARSDKSVYCAEDERAAGTSSSDYQLSAVHLRADTLGDRLKASSPASRNVAVAGKDRTAVMSSGRSADQRWYWDGRRFATDLKGAAVPRTVTALNSAFAASLAAPQPGLEPPALCQAKAHPFALGGGLTVGTGRLERAAGDAKGIRATPAFDAAVLAMAAGLVQEMRLGRGAATTDLLSVGLSATDFVGHSFGSGGQEMCLQLLALDRELGDFLAVMDRTGTDYAVLLTADHGAMDMPERLRAKGIDAQRADPELSPARVGARVAAQLGLSGRVLIGDKIGGNVWIDRAIQGANRERAARTAMQLYKDHPQVQEVFYRPNIMSLPMPGGDPSKWTLFQRVRAAFDPARSGDFVVVLKPYVSPIARPSSGSVAGHGSPWDYDRRVPVVLWRPGMARAERTEAIATVDIMPTLGAMVRLPAIGAPVAGKCLRDIPGVLCPER